MEALGEPFQSILYNNLDSLYDNGGEGPINPVKHWRTQLLRAIEARETKAKAMDQNAERDRAKWGAIALREFLEGMK